MKEAGLLTKHGLGKGWGSMCDDSQETTRRLTATITTRTTTITAPTPLLLLLLILGREVITASLNLLYFYILVIGWVRACPGMHCNH